MTHFSYTMLHIGTRWMSEISENCYLKKKFRAYPAHGVHSSGGHFVVQWSAAACKCCCCCFCTKLYHTWFNPFLLYLSNMPAFFVPEALSQQQSCRNAKNMKGLSTFPWAGGFSSHFSHIVWLRDNGVGGPRSPRGPKGVNNQRSQTVWCYVLSATSFFMTDIWFQLSCLEYILYRIPLTAFFLYSKVHSSTGSLQYCSFNQVSIVYFDIVLNSNTQ